MLAAVRSYPVFLIVLASCAAHDPRAVTARGSAIEVDVSLPPAEGHPPPTASPSASSVASSPVPDAPTDVADYGVVFFDSIGRTSATVVLLQHREVCGADPNCPNALVTYGSGRIVEVACDWRPGTVCNVDSCGREQETPESEPKLLCKHVMLEIVDAPSKPGAIGKVRIRSLPDGTVTSKGDIDTLVSGSTW
jgi:hypothetical protein